KSQSVPQSPQASTVSRPSSAPTVGTGSCRSSVRSGATATAAVAVRTLVFLVRDLSKGYEAKPRGRASNSILSLRGTKCRSNLQSGARLLRGARNDTCVKRALRLINIRFGNRHQIAGVHERCEVAVPGAQEGIQLLGAQHHGLARVHVADHECFF